MIIPQKNTLCMLGHRFSKFVPPPQSEKSDFENLLKMFMQLLLITSGNVTEALQWLTEVDQAVQSHHR